MRSGFVRHALMPLTPRLRALERYDSCLGKTGCSLQLVWKKGNWKKRPGLILQQNRTSNSKRNWTASLKPEQQEIQIFSCFAGFDLSFLFWFSEVWICCFVTFLPDKLFWSPGFPLQPSLKAVIFLLNWAKEHVEFPWFSWNVLPLVAICLLMVCSRILGAG